MSDDKTEPGKAEEPAAAPSAAHAEPKKDAAASDHAPAAASQDYSKHFEELFRHVTSLPEKLIDALREAVPKKEADPVENQHNTVHQEKTEAEGAVTPGKTGQQAAGSELGRPKTPWGHRFLGGK